MQSDSESDIDILSNQESDVDSPDEHNAGGSSTLKFPRQFLQLFIFISIWQAAFKISTSAICKLLKFLKWFCFAIGIAFNCTPLTTLSKAMPVAKSTSRKMLALDGLTSWSMLCVQLIFCTLCITVSSPYDKGLHKESVTIEESGFDSGGVAMQGVKPELLHSSLDLRHLRFLTFRL